MNQQLSVFEAEFPHEFSDSRIGHSHPWQYKYVSSSESAGEHHGTMSKERLCRDLYLQGLLRENTAKQKDKQDVVFDKVPLHHDPVKKKVARKFVRGDLHENTSCQQQL